MTEVPWGQRVTLGGPWRTRRVCEVLGEQSGEWGCVRGNRGGALGVMLGWRSQSIPGEGRLLRVIVGPTASPPLCWGCGGPLG